jgi:uracil-DNA glycosylase family 4
VSGDADLAPVLEYLRALGWDEIYSAPRRGGAGAEQSRTGPVAETRAEPRGSLREAVSAARESAPGSPRATTAARPSPSPVPAPADPPLSFSLDVPAAADDRNARLGEVAVAALACRRCRLAGGRKSVVFASGNPDADLMFVGEGPGAEEDRQGLPFVGPAGQLLTKIIQAMGHAREDVYIANVVKCRPPGNRDPQPDEVAACRPFLEAQVRLVRPRVIVALGRVAAQTLLGLDLPVARMRGHWHELLGVPLRVTYHPAAILRDASLKRPTWDDMLVVRDRLAGAGSG